VNDAITGARGSGFVPPGSLGVLPLQPDTRMLVMTSAKTESRWWALAVVTEQSSSRLVA
jgi:hypothetical protein